MAVVYITEGRVALLEMLRAADSSNWRLGLFQTPIAPSPTDVYNTYDTAKANYVGYAAQTLTWGPAVPFGALGKSQGSLATFTGPASGPSNTIYGYYYYHATLLKVLFAEALVTPKLMASTADVLNITPAMTENQG